MNKTRTLTLALASLASGGCTAMLVADILMSKEYSATFTLRGDEADLSSLDRILIDQLDLATEVQLVETGVRIIKFVGVASDIVGALRQFTGFGLQILANDTVAETILRIALAGL